MNRSEIESEVKQAFGIFPGWMSSMPDPVLDQYWAVTKWVTSDSSLNARDKALVAFGAASALHCEY